MKLMPRDDKMRKALRHPSAGAFPASGPAYWPEDAFTTRRLRDGDVTEVKEPPTKANEPPKKATKAEG